MVNNDSRGLETDAGVWECYGDVVTGSGWVNVCVLGDRGADKVWLRRSQAPDRAEMMALGGGTIVRGWLGQRGGTEALVWVSGKEYKWQREESGRFDGKA